MNLYIIYIYIYIYIERERGTPGVMDIIITNGHGELSSNPVYISHNTNNLWKSMNSTILPPALGIVGQTELFNLAMATSLGERKLWI